MMEDLSGKQFDEYKIISQLGKGGMATIYMAFQPNMERNVALKVLPKQHAKDPEFLGRFKQEAKLIAGFQHPHILPVFDFGEADGYTYLVMAYIEGGTLTDILQGEPLDKEQTIQYITQLSGALDYAHKRKVIHRDLKPSNVLIGSSGNCLLADFGVAKILGGSNKFTATGEMVGTPSYMSPEQIQGIPLDTTSDIYSLGIILYEMVTSRPPFKGATPASILIKHLHEPLPPPSFANPDMPKAVEQVIIKSLEKDSKDRYQKAGDLAKALKKAYDQ